jgi:kinesin family protein 13
MADKTTCGNGDAVRVAVRVRPLLPRELDAGGQCIMDMTEQSAMITDPTAFLSSVADDAEKSGKSLELWKTTFNFDRCFNSCEQIQTERQEEDQDGVGKQIFSKLATQQDVFDTYGPWVVDNIMQGYNCCIFAYGQTGSGKTHTMMGDTTSEEHMGLTPRTCRELFKQMAAASQRIKFRVY